MTRRKPKATPGETSRAAQSLNLRLNSLSSKLTKFQRELFDIFWKHFQENDKWFPTRVVHSQIGTKQVRDALQSLGGDIVRELENQPNDTYELSLIGVLLTSEGEKYRQLMVKYLEFLRDEFLSHPEKVEFTSKEIQVGLSLSDPQATILGGLIRLGHSFGAANWGKDFWTVRAPKEIEYLPSGVSLDASLDEWLFRHFQQRPVFAQEARREWSQNNQIALSGMVEIPQIVSQPAGSSIDVLKRRYQVFVSSTYDDLKEERQHVIQALLETKCIPLGMELFPAASIEQWKLIKRIIDECDYYVVLVAGRYGSLNESQIGYTEMEFNYALSIAKPVLGFYHSNPETLPVSKSEKTDLGRDSLKRFTDKIKKRICRPWSSAAELGSAVKSAIIHELEFNPKPGWVRADAITSSDQVEKLKQRIADLEERLKREYAQDSSHSSRADKITVSVEALLRHYKQRHTEIIPLDINYSTEDLFGICAELFDIEGAWSEYRRKGFADLTRDRIKNALAVKFPKARFQESRISREGFEFVLHTLIAQELFMVTSDEWTENSGAYIRLTEKGLIRMSRLRVETKRIDARR